MHPFITAIAVAAGAIVGIAALNELVTAAAQREAEHQFHTFLAAHPELTA